jgi:hypothetical protein
MFHFLEGVMKKLLLSLTAIIVITGAFFAEAVAAYPVNGDWHRIAPPSQGRHRPPQ